MLAATAIDARAAADDEGCATSSNDPACEPRAGTFYGLAVAQATTSRAGDVAANATADDVWDQAIDGDDAGASREERWMLSPVSWQGQLMYDFRHERRELGATTTRNQLTARIGAATYLWKPWFAIVDGSLAATGGVESAHLQDDRFGEQSSGHDAFFTGSLGLRLLPRSRFPFEARIETTDSRLQATGAALDYRNTKIRLDQRYTPLDNTWSMYGTYEHDVQTGQALGRDVQDTLSVGYQLTLPLQTLSIDATASGNTRAATDERSRYDTLVARHYWRPHDGLTVDSSANVTRTLYDLTFGRVDVRLSQANAIALYLPVDSPWSFNASARASVVDVDRSGTSESLALSVGGNYEFSRTLRASAAVSLFQSKSGSAEATGVGGSGNLTWQSEVRTIAGFDVSYFASAGASQASSEGRSVSTAAVQAGYAVNRSWPVSSQTAVSTSINQSLGYARTSNEIATPLIATNAGIAVNWASGASLAYSRLSVNDARATAGGGASSTIVNLQFNGVIQFGRASSLSGDMTLQQSWQRIEALTDSPGDTPADAIARLINGRRHRQQSASGNVTYADNQVFGVPRLRFSSQLRIASDAVREANPLAPIADRATAEWITRLDYTIGRLSFGAYVSIAEIDGRRTSTTLLRVWRDFGN